MSDRIQIGNTIIIKSHVSAVMEDPDKENEVLVLLDNGERLRFTGDDALEVWKEFADRDWRG